MTSMDTDRQTLFSSIKPHTVRGALLDGTQLLQAAGIDSARLEAEVLMGHVLGFEKSQLYLSLDEQLDDGVKYQFDFFFDAPVPARAVGLHYRPPRVLVA